MTAARYRHPNAQWLGSPNYSPNRDGHDLVSDPRYIIMHTMVGTWQGANGRFQQAAQQASAHYGVCLDGALKQWVDEGDASWAAGNYQVNLDAINIEHEDGGLAGAIAPGGGRPDALKARSAQLIAEICKRYGMPCDRTHIRLHKEVSVAPTACPDTLEVTEIVSRAQAILAPKPPPDPEWKTNLKANAQSFLLAKPVSLVHLISRTPVRTIAVGRLDVAGETVSGNVEYWMTQYAIDHGTGDGIAKAEVAAAIVVPPPLPPPPDPLAPVRDWYREAPAIIQ